MTSEVLHHIKSVTRETYDKKCDSSTFHELTPTEYLIDVADYLYYRYAVRHSGYRLYFKSSDLWQGRYLAKVSQDNGIIVRYKLNA